MPFRSPFPIGPRPKKDVQASATEPESIGSQAWMSVSEAAVFLGVTPKQIREWILSGQLLAKPVRHGMHWRYRILKQHLELFTLEKPSR